MAPSSDQQLVELVIATGVAMEFDLDLIAAATVGSSSLEYHRRIEEILVDGVTDSMDGTYLVAGLLCHLPLPRETALLTIANQLLLGVHVDDLPPAFRDRIKLPDSPYLGIGRNQRRYRCQWHRYPDSTVGRQTDGHAVDNTAMESTNKA